MEFLLKIVEGAAKGAEIALVGGMRLKLGRGTDCDIVINDASLAEVACELDVGENAVMMLKTGAAPLELKPFEINKLGEVALAIGPAEGEWQELREKEEQEAEAGVGVEVGVGAGDGAADEVKDGDGEAKKAEIEVKEEEEKQERKTGILVWVALLVLLLILGICGFLAWQLGYAEIVTAKVNSYWVKVGWGGECEGSKAEVTQRPAVTFENVVRLHGLKVIEEDERRIIRGNLKRRTERLAIRAMALAEDRSYRFDLTDDETLRSSAEALLYVVTESCVKIAVATNRVLELTGYVPSEEAAKAVTAALKADVPGVSAIIWDQVVFGGSVPAVVAETRFAQTGEMTPPPVIVATESKSEEPQTESKSAAVAPGKARFRQQYAGVIVKPYPCVVLANGMRLTEGAQIGSAVIVAIDEEKVTLKDGDKVTEQWL